MGITAALYLGDGHIQRGLRILESSPGQRKNDSDIHLRLAEIYRQHERPQEAERSLKRSIAIRATASAWKELAILQGDGGRHIEGDRSWRRALALAPSDDAILSGFALSLGRRGIRLSEAKAMAIRALRSDSLNPGHLLAAGVVELNRRDYDRGLRYIQRSTELDGRNPQAFEDLGSAWLALGNQYEADKAWRRAEELDPEGRRIQSRTR
jgi:tetratricopeptide (TPR) repeat protein